VKEGHMKWHIILGKVLIVMFITMAVTRCTTDNEAKKWLEAKDTESPPTEALNSPATISESFTMDITDERGSAAFIFENVSTVDLYTIVLDADNPVAGSLVQIKERNGTNNRVIFQAVSSASGEVTGSFTIDTVIDIVQLVINYKGKEHKFDIQVKELLKIGRKIYFNSSITPTQVMDTDADGIPDDQDAYPNDATKATMVRYPAQSTYTLAFEDLYPNKGDADFNDYVLSISHEEDLDAQGKVVAIRGNYVHIARGAGYKHTLHMRLPSLDQATLVKKHTKPNGTIVSNTTTTLTDGQDLDLMPRSDTTISQSNTGTSQPFKIGDSLAFELTFTQPIDRTSLGSAPYDIFIKVINTGHEIHLTGKYQATDGSDIYLDSDGFPWALLVPNSWQWMYERKNIHDAYPNFINWYSSNGVVNRDWYDLPVDTFVFPYLGQ